MNVEDFIELCRWVQTEKEVIMNEETNPSTDLSDAEIRILLNLAHCDIAMAKRKVAEFESELERRRLAKQVRVRCPTCGGRGKTTELDWQSGWDYDRQCYSCSGTGYILADPA
jgi:DnaJ-class molecular chaperone